MPRRPLRVALVIGSVLLALGSVVEFAGWRSEQRRLAQVLAARGVLREEPSIVERVRRQPDSERARLVVARALLAAELAPERQGVTGPAAAAGLARLETAAALAGETLPRRPAAWQAALVAGAAGHLAERRGGGGTAGRGSGPDPLAALRAATELAPGQPEPARFLAAVHLGDWSRLSAERRAAALPVLASAFRDRRSFDLLIGDWLRVAPSLEAALEVLPARPETWDRLRAHYLQADDLERYRDVHARWDAWLAAFLEERIAEARRRRRGGDERRALALLHSVATAPPDRRFAPLLAQALAELPPGPPPPVALRYYRPWLDWALQQCLFADCALPPVALRRLTHAAQGGEGPTRGSDAPRDETAARHALAALAAGRPELAVVYEQRAPDPGGEAWAEYHLLAARRALEAGDTEEAAERLRQVHASWRESALYRRLRATADRPDLPAAAARGAEGGAGWRWRGSVGFYEVEATAPAGEVRVVLEAPADAAAVVELQWNGVAAAFAAVRGRRAVRLPGPAEPGLHLLEIRALAGRVPRPGPVSLRPG